MIYCPCCSGLLLPHIRSSQIYWFCRHCWQEMPVFAGEKPDLLPEILSEELLEQPRYQKNIRTKVYTSKPKLSNEWIRIQEMPA
ncbi:MAG: hypothetical protein KME23_27145 [Goleter apudmare HA4340-LM2]|nr:hypothetical protein [Goleter apudmare HA4340-LM2]